MTIRGSKRYCQLLVLSLGLCVAATAFARGDDDSSREASDDGDKASSSQSHESEKGDGDKGDGDKGDGESKKAKRKSSKHSAEASAEPELDDTAISVAVLGSFGPSSESLRGGLGLRAGLHLGEGTSFYFGGTGTYFFGHEAVGTSGSSSQSTFMYFGGEAGIDIPVLSSVSMRPYFGLGLGRKNVELCGSDGMCASDASYAVTITPGVLGLYELGSGFFVGGDLRFLIAAGASDVSGPVLTATVGMKF